MMQCTAKACVFRFPAMAGAVFFLHLVIFLGLSTAAGAAEVEATGTISGVAAETEVGVPPSQDGPRAQPVAPYSTPTERKPAEASVSEGVSYVVKAAHSNPGKNLVLNCTVDRQEDEATLSRLAEKIYKDHNGKQYEDVTILWHIGMNPEPAKPWAKTEISKVKADFAIVKL